MMRWLGALAVLLVWVPPVTAQGPSPSPAGYQPLNPSLSPGRIGRWSVQARHPGLGQVAYFQPVEIRLLRTGEAGNAQVTWYDGPDRRPLALKAPAKIGLRVGEIYRLQISRMSDFPGVSLYPTLEVIDRLHPPGKRRFEFPVPVEVTGEDVRLALEGRLVTRVVYLEEPRLSGGLEQLTPMTVRDLSARANLLTEADRVGRPMVILRLGSRQPPSSRQATAFFGTGASVETAPSTPGRQTRVPRRSPK